MKRRPVVPAYSVPAERIESRILLVRRHRVMLDADLAELYGVPTRVLNQAVKRNKERFPSDFMFRSTPRDMAVVNRSQFVIGSQKHRNLRITPCVFTEHGALMAANVLKSRRAVMASVYVVRAFVRLRLALASYRDVARKLSELERRLGTHDNAIRGLVVTIRDMMQPPPERQKERIGFHRRRPAVSGS